MRETREFVEWRDAVMTFDLRYEFPDDVLVSRSRIRFWTEGEIRSRIAEAGLEVVALHGDWGGEGFDPRSSEEMVFVVGPVIWSRHPTGSPLP